MRLIVYGVGLRMAGKGLGVCPEPGTLNVGFRDNGSLNPEPGTEGFGIGKLAHRTFLPRRLVGVILCTLCIPKPKNILGENPTHYYIRNIWRS